MKPPAVWRYDLSVRRTTLFLCLLSSATFAAQPARIAFLGDSITYDGRWPALVESALRATPQFADADLVLACYGMNDGIYLPPDQSRL